MRLKYWLNSFFFFAILCITITFSLSAQAADTHSGLPEVRITLAEGLTAETINNGSKDTKYQGNTVTFRDTDESVVLSEDVEIKGRGNYTWNVARMIKKPYQLKLSSKTKVFGMGKAKKMDSARKLFRRYFDA